MLVAKSSREDGLWVVYAIFSHRICKNHHTMKEMCSRKMRLVTRNVWTQTLSLDVDIGGPCSLKYAFMPRWGKDCRLFFFIPRSCSIIANSHIAFVCFPLCSRHKHPSGIESIEYFFHHPDPDVLQTHSPRSRRPSNPHPQKLCFSCKLIMWV